MTYPNPAGFYGLQMPVAVETEFNELDYVEVAETLNDITYSLTLLGTDLAFEYLSADAQAFYDELKVDDRISLVRWLAEGLAVLARGTEPHD